MANVYSEAAILSLYEDLVVDNLCDKNYNDLLQLLIEITDNNSKLDNYLCNYLILNIFNLLEINSIISPAAALLIKEAKVKITRVTSMNLPFVKDNFKEIDENIIDTLSKEIFYEKDGILIYKAYKPSEFTLPDKGEKGYIYVMGDVSNDSSKQYKQKILINDRGITLELIGEPIITDKDVDNSSIKYDDIYKSLLSEVLDNEK